MRKKVIILLSIIASLVLSAGLGTGIYFWNHGGAKASSTIPYNPDDFTIGANNDVVNANVKEAKSTSEIDDLITEHEGKSFTLSDAQYSELKSANSDLSSPLVFSKNGQDVSMIGVVENDAKGKRIRPASLDEVFQSVDYQVTAANPTTTTTGKPVHPVKAGETGMGFNLSAGATVESSFKKGTVQGQCSVYWAFGVSGAITNLDIGLGYDLFTNHLTFHTKFDYEIHMDFGAGLSLDLVYKDGSIGDRVIEDVPTELDAWTYDAYQPKRIINDMQSRFQSSVVQLPCVFHAPEDDDSSWISGIGKRSFELIVATIYIPYLDVLNKVGICSLPVILYMNVGGDMHLEIADQFAYELHGVADVDYDNQRSSGPALQNRSHLIKHSVKNTFTINGKLRAVFDFGVAFQFKVASQWVLFETTGYIEIEFYAAFTQILQFKFDFIKGNADHVFYFEGSGGMTISLHLDVNFRLAIKNPFHIGPWEFSQPILACRLCSFSFFKITVLIARRNGAIVSPGDPDYAEIVSDFLDDATATGAPSGVTSAAQNTSYDAEHHPEFIETSHDEGIHYVGQYVKYSVKLRNESAYKLKSLTYSFNGTDHTVSLTDELYPSTDYQTVNFLASSSSTHLDFYIEMPSVSGTDQTFQFQVKQVVADYVIPNETTVNTGTYVPTSALTSEIKVLSLGDGTSGNPYKIFTAADFSKLNSGTQSNAILMEDIDCDNLSYFSGLDSYQCAFNGNGKTLSNLRLTNSTSGFFGTLAASANIHDLNFKDCVSFCDSFAGIVAAENRGTIANIHLSGCNCKGSENVGLVAGLNSGSISSIEIASGLAVCTEYRCGLISGINANGGSINGCTITDSTIQGGSYLGGVTGINNSSLKDCHVSNGTLSGTRYLGGIAGYCSTITSAASMDTVSFSGQLSGTSYGGGIVGYFESGSLVNFDASENSVTLSFVSNYGLIYGGLGRGIIIR
jgi:hypothetical protein